MVLSGLSHTALSLSLYFHLDGCDCRIDSWQSPDGGGSLTVDMYFNFLTCEPLAECSMPMQGAQVPESAVIDTLDVMDLPMLKCGIDSVIGEGTTIVGHTIKDGSLVFGEVRVNCIQGCLTWAANCHLGAADACFWHRAASQACMVKKDLLLMHAS